MRTDPNSTTTESVNSWERKPAASCSSPETSRQERVDRASLSLEPRLGHLVSQVSCFPEIRKEKVAAISRALRDGSYRVSPEQTAEAMINEAVGAGSYGCPAYSGPTWQTGEQQNAVAAANALDAQ